MCPLKNGFTFLSSNRDPKNSKVATVLIARRKSKSQELFSYCQLQTIENQKYKSIIKIKQSLSTSEVSKASQNLLRWSIKHVTFPYLFIKVGTTYAILKNGIQSNKDLCGIPRCSCYQPIIMDTFFLSISSFLQ